MSQNELGKYRYLFTKSVFNNFIHFLVADDFIDSRKAKLDHVKYLTLENGLFDLETEELILHTAKIFTTNLLPYKFDPEAKCPLWVKYLDDVFLGDKDKIIFAQESIGYAFLKEIPKPAIFFLVGPGSNGKSVFIDTITNLFGEDNVSTISLKQLSDEQYTLGLMGKMINISTETPPKKMINTDIIKAIVAGDWVSGRKLYKEPSKFKPFAKHFLAMNKFPHFDDISHGWWRRIYPIEFLRIFKEDEMDVTLTEKLAKELSGIFNWALEGYRRLRNNKYVFSNSEFLLSAKSKYQNESNMIFSFISKFLEKMDDDDRIRFKQVYELYQNYCNSEGEKEVIKKGEFKKSIENAGYKISKSTKDGNAVCVFGVKIKDKSEE